MLTPHSRLHSRIPPHFARDIRTDRVLDSADPFTHNHHLDLLRLDNTLRTCIGITTSATRFASRAAALAHAAPCRQDFFTLSTARLHCCTCTLPPSFSASFARSRLLEFTHNIPLMRASCIAISSLRCAGLYFHAFFPHCRSRTMFCAPAGHHVRHHFGSAPNRFASHHSCRAAHIYLTHRTYSFGSSSLIGFALYRTFHSSATTLAFRASVHWTAPPFSVPFPLHCLVHYTLSPLDNSRLPRGLLFSRFIFRPANACAPTFAARITRTFTRTHLPLSYNTLPRTAVSCTLARAPDFCAPLHTRLRHVSTYAARTVVLQHLPLDHLTAHGTHTATIHSPLRFHFYSVCTFAFAPQRAAALLLYGRALHHRRGIMHRYCARRRLFAASGFRSRLDLLRACCRLSFSSLRTLTAFLRTRRWDIFSVTCLARTLPHAQQHCLFTWVLRFGRTFSSHRARYAVHTPLSRFASFRSAGTRSLCARMDRAVSLDSPFSTTRTRAFHTSRIPDCCRSHARLSAPRSRHCTLFILPRFRLRFHATHALFRTRLVSSSPAGHLLHTLLPHARRCILHILDIFTVNIPLYCGFLSRDCAPLRGSGTHRAYLLRPNSRSHTHSATTGLLLVLHTAHSFWFPLTAHRYYILYGHTLTTAIHV